MHGLLLPRLQEVHLTMDPNVEIEVQVGGKLRGTIHIPVTATSDEAFETALAETSIATHVAGKTVKKVVYVPGKMISFIMAAPPDEVTDFTPVRRQSP
jgi:leucyl-tRNA synthetase